MYVKENSIVSGTPYLIRQATLNDLDRIYFHWKAGVGDALSYEKSSLWEVKEKRYKEIFRKKFDEVDEIFNIWVAVKGSEVVGWQYLMPCENNPATRHLTGEVSTYVSPDHRGQGVGTILLKYALVHAKSTPLQYVIGYVSEGNKTIQSIVEKLGMVKSGEFPPPLKEPRGSAAYIYIYTVPQR